MFKLLKDNLKKVFGKFRKESEESLKESEVKEEKNEIKEEKQEAKEAKEEKKSIFSIIKEKFISKTSEEDFENSFQQLEIVLLENNVAVSVIDKIKSRLKEKILNRQIKSSEIENEVKKVLKEILSDILVNPFNLIEKIKEKKEKPFVIVFFGINGSGKTTTIAKISYLLQKNKLSNVIAAADTFRAASIEQLEKHALKLKTEIVKHKYGADPAAVAYDAIAHAKATKKDVVLVDTAGRMHTKSDLMREMEKICRVTRPDLKIFVAESITGNDAVEQAQAFDKAAGIDAVILTKADVDEKGGTMISISEVIGKPILYLGTGQGYENLSAFDKEKIINSIL